MYIASDDGSVYAANTADNLALWTANGESARITANLAVSETAVYVPLNGFQRTPTKGLIALDPESGAEIWSMPIDNCGRIREQVVYHDGQLIFQCDYDGSDTGGGILYGLNAATGDQDWSFNPRDFANYGELDSLMTSPGMAVADGIVFGSG